MAISLGSEAPDFTAETTEGTINFHDWIGDSWAVLFSHPKDFTPVCTTELGYMAKLQPEFEKRGVKVIGLSVDERRQPREVGRRHRGDPGRRARTTRSSATPTSTSSKLYGMLPESTSGDSETRTPADNQTVRNVFVIGPDKKVKLILVYPMTTGRNFDEVLRVHRLAPAHRQAPRRHAGELEAGRGRHHRRLGLQRRGQGDLRHLGRAEALHQDHEAAQLSYAGTPMASV